MRQAALERIKGPEGAAAKQSDEETAATKPVEETKSQETKSKEEPPASKSTETAATPAPAKSSLSAMLSRQEDAKAAKEPDLVAESTNGAKRRAVYSKEEMLRYVLPMICD